MTQRNIFCVLMTILIRIGNCAVYLFCTIVAKAHLFNRDIFSINAGKLDVLNSSRKVVAVICYDDGCFLRSLPAVLPRIIR